MGGKLWSFLLLGCCLLAGCQQTETVSVPPVVGCYPVEGYAPDPADLAAAPYTYTGGAQGISVTCTVRQAEPAAFFALLQEKYFPWKNRHYDGNKGYHLCDRTEI